MRELFASPFFGVAVTVGAYAAGVKLQKKTGLVICNALIVSAVAIVALLLVFDIPYEDYYAGGSLINLMLTPATACFAVSIYSRLDVLKKNLLPVLVGCTVGATASVVSIWSMCHLFGFERELMISLLPKSVTTPIATAISGGNGGIISITAVAVIFTGIMGNLCAPLMIRLFRVKDPVAAGLGIGACSHAIGTARAMELGGTEGAVSSVAIGLCGIVTTLLALVFPYLP